MNIITSLLLAFLIAVYPSSSYSQESDDNFTDSVEQVLEVGSLKIDAVYLYQDTEAPYEGYLLKLEDVAQIKIIMDDFEVDCNRWLEQVKQTCLEDLQKCQEDSGKRVKACHDERDILRNDLLKAKEELKGKDTKILIWTATGSVIGIAVGIITTFAIK
jgi:hypothetical protein